MKTDAESSRVLPYTDFDDWMDEAEKLGYTLHSALLGERWTAWKADTQVGAFESEGWLKVTQ